jgi:hypothetical protein
MSFFENLKEKIDEKLSSGDSMQYIMAGTLILVIVIALGFVISSVFNGGPGAGEAVEARFYCLETGKEFTIDPADNPEMMMGDPMMGGRVTSPYTNEKTGVPMMRCPACEEYFVPEAWKQEPQPGQPPMMMMDPMGQQIVCPHCNTDIHEYYRQKARERRNK